MLLYLFKGPPKRLAHPRQLDGRERLEVQHNGPIAYQVGYVLQMTREVDVK